MPESSCCVPRWLSDGCAARPTADPARVGVAPQQTSPGRFIVRKAELGRLTIMMQQNLSPGPLRNICHLEQRGAPSPVCQKWHRSLRLIRSGCLPLAMLALFAGCSSPAVRQQRLIARSNMTFSDNVAFSYNSPRLLSQFATGFGGSGAAQNSGCTSCR